MSERIDSAHDFLEQEVREAFRRGTRTPERRELRSTTDAHSRGRRSALHAGMLQIAEGA